MRRLRTQGCAGTINWVLHVVGVCCVLTCATRGGVLLAQSARDRGIRASGLLPHDKLHGRAARPRKQELDARPAHCLFHIGLCNRECGCDAGSEQAANLHPLCGPHHHEHRGQHHGSPPLGVHITLRRVPDLLQLQAVDATTRQGQVRAESTRRVMWSMNVHAVSVALSKGMLTCDPSSSPTVFRIRPPMTRRGPLGLPPPAAAAGAATRRTRHGSARTRGLAPSRLHCGAVSRT